jgi:hypothetical protein
MTEYKVPHFMLTGAALHDEKPHAARHMLGSDDEVWVDGAQFGSGLILPAAIGNGIASGSSYPRGDQSFAGHLEKAGLWPAMVAGQWYDARFALELTQSTFGIGPSSLSASPFLVPKAVTVDQLSVEITVAGSAGSKLRAGIYAATGEGRPGKLLYDSGELPLDVATLITHTLTAPLIIGPGLYYPATFRNATATFRVYLTSSSGIGPLGGTTVATLSRNCSYSRTVTYGPLPASFGTPTIGIAAARVALHVT